MLEKIIYANKDEEQKPKSTPKPGVPLRPKRPGATPKPGVPLRPKTND